MVLPGQKIPSRLVAPSFLLLLLLLLVLPEIAVAKLWCGPSSVNLPVTWTTSEPYDFILTNAGIMAGIKAVLCRLNSGPSFLYGFICYDGNLCYFGLFAFQPTQDMTNINPVLVWFVSQEPMKTGQMLLTKEGDIVLQGDDGNKIWSTNTGGKSAVGLNLTEVGNVVLYDRKDAIIWQSFDHPANGILPGQVLRPGMKLTATSSTPKTVYTFTTDDQIGFVASVSTAYSPKIYYRTDNVKKMKGDVGKFAALYNNGSFGEFDFPPTSAAQFIRLEKDGHLKHYVYDEYSNDWNAADLLADQVGSCRYPFVCGSYGICLRGLQCKCPSMTKQIVEKDPSSVCNSSSHLSCDSHENTFVEAEHVTYFALLLNSTIADIPNTTAESCKEACLRKGCSCTMALFRGQTTSSVGDCHFLSEPFSLMDDSSGYYSSLAFIKVDTSTSTVTPSSMVRRKSRGQTALILGTTVGAVSIFLASVFGIYISRKMRRNHDENDDPDLPRLHITRFSYEDLKVMTGDFKIKLGKGGFGSVFLGTLPGGVRIAVKRLDGFSQIKKSFLAEAETIGTVHHVNLVRLLGFCAEKSHRLLVYEYMCNGSLDKWIFLNDQEFDLCWQVRRKIILDIAKGLAYLHEECHQKIIHLDIKPQNILLDEHFNAKLADFGLSKLIDKDQSHVIISMRGTPGYLAPEWLSSIITEKVDVYSFGIVMLEILCGRKNVDRSLPTDEVHMLSLFKCRAEQEQLLEMVDKSSNDMQQHGEEAVQMMKIATWCLQDDHRKRPFMSAVVKCLQGLVSIDSLSYSFSVPSGHDKQIVDEVTQLSALQLSGPR